MIKNTNFCSGQAMILTVTLVTGALIGASAIAGSLMLRQIRQSTRSVDSTKAIFAAETGIELELYRQFKNSPSYPVPILSKSQATFTVSTSSDSIKSVGVSKASSRALEVNLVESR